MNGRPPPLPTYLFLGCARVRVSSRRDKDKTLGALNARRSGALESGRAVVSPSLRPGWVCLVDGYNIVGACPELDKLKREGRMDAARASLTNDMRQVKEDDKKTADWW